MAKLPDMVPVADLRHDTARVLRRVRGKRTPVVITQHGRAAAVLLGIKAYERSEHEKELLRILARGETEIRAGKGYDLDAVLAEADALIPGSST